MMWIILVLCLCYINLLLMFSFMKGFKAMFLYFQQTWFLQDYIRRLIPGWWSALLWRTKALEMGAASSQQLWFLNSKDSQLLLNRPINWYLFSPRGDTCFCLIKKKHPNTHLEQIFNNIIYQNKFIKSIQRPLQSLAAIRTVFGTHNGHCHFLHRSTHSSTDSNWQFKHRSFQF